MLMHGRAGKLRHRVLAGEIQTCSWKVLGAITRR